MKHSLFFIFILFFNLVHSQTVTLISPTGSGGFESGTTFSANGWTQVNSTTQYWRIGTASPGYSGSRGAYWGTSTANTFTLTTSRTGHFYRDVTIPTGATSVVLSWSMKGSGEIGYDRLLVYKAPTTVTPIANSPVSGSTSISGATLLYTQTAFFTTYTSQSLTLTGVAGTTFRLIFTWQNDNTGGVNPPVAIDNISLTYISVCSGTPSAGSITASVSSGCSSYFSTLTASGTSSGSGITYQWESSPDNSSWSIVPGATTTIFSPFVSTTIYYRLKATCSNSSLSSYSASTALFVNSLPSSITGSSNVCVGSNILLGSTPSGGTWSSSNTTKATVNSSGFVTGISTGTATITYTLPTGCSTTKSITINTLPAAITGLTSVCVGSNITLSSSTPGGTWTSSNVALGTVNPAGIVSGLSSGTVIITYSLSIGCSVYKSVTVKSSPSAIVGPTDMCVGSDTTLSSLPVAGTWTSSNSTVATIGSTTGILTCISAGVVTLYYSINTGCSVSSVVTVNTLPSNIVGSSMVCEGSDILLNSTPAGGVWTSSNTTVATVSSGSVSGNSAGVVTITYTLFSACATYKIITVNASPSNITGITDVCKGSNTNLSCSPIGGTWTSSNSVIAGVSSAGIVTGAAAGNVLITYTIANGCYKNIPISVHNLPSPIINYSIYGPCIFVNSFSVYEWYKDGIAIPGSNMNIIFPTDIGTYTILVTDSNGCKNMSAPYAISPELLKVSDSIVGEEIKIYPNPVYSKLFIKSTKPVNAMVIGIDGKLILEQKKVTSIDFENVVDGYYFILIFNQTGTILKIDKIVKQKT